VVIATETLSRFCARQFTGGFGDGALARHPCRFNAIEPRAFGRQLTDHQATATGALDPLVMSPDPGPDGAADVPGGVVPDQQERRLAIVGPPCSQPPEKLGGHQTDWPPVDNADQHGLGVGPQPAIAGERFGFGILPVRRVLDQAYGVTVCPGMQRRGGHAAPPDFIGEP